MRRSTARWVTGFVIVAAHITASCLCAATDGMAEDKTQGRLLRLPTGSPLAVLDAIAREAGIHVVAVVPDDARHSPEADEPRYLRETSLSRALDSASRSLRATWRLSEGSVVLTPKVPAYHTALTCQRYCGRPDPFQSIVAARALDFLDPLPPGQRAHLLSGRAVPWRALSPEAQRDCESLFSGALDTIADLLEQGDESPLLAVGIRWSPRMHLFADADADMPLLTESVGHVGPHRYRVRLRSASLPAISDYLEDLHRPLPFGSTPAGLGAQQSPSAYPPSEAPQLDSRQVTVSRSEVRGLGEMLSVACEGGADPVTADLGLDGVPVFVSEGTYDPDELVGLLIAASGLGVRTVGGLRVLGTADAALLSRPPDVGTALRHTDISAEVARAFSEVVPGSDLSEWNVPFVAQDILGWKRTPVSALPAGRRRWVEATFGELINNLSESKAADQKALATCRRALQAAVAEVQLASYYLVCLEEYDLRVEDDLESRRELGLLPDERAYYSRGRTRTVQVW